MVTIFHTDTLTQFIQQIYKDLLKREHLVSNEQAKKFGNKEVLGYIMERDNQITKLKERYFVRTDDVENLPLKILEWKKFIYRSEVFRLVNRAQTCKIPSRQEMSFREMADYYADYEHSNPTHWKPARIIMLAAYIERVNIRMVSEASFGKDALCDILQILNGNVSNLYNATLAKLKYALNNDLIIVNELGGLKVEEIGNLQVYLTQAGSYKHQYENNSRSFAGVKEVMSLANKSHVIFHNTPWYYEKKKQKYFEQMFTRAIMDRFPAVLFEGWVSEDFTKADPIESFGKEEVDNLKSFIASLNWCKQHPVQEPKFVVDDSFWEFRGREMQRSLRSFKVISKYFAEYAGTESEFLELCEILKESRMSYLRMIGKEPVRQEKIG